MWRVVGIILLVFSLLGMAACASESVLLVQPRTGATIKCSAAGSGLMAGMAAGMVDECVKKYEGDGYVPEGRLAPEERADLERRGVLPKPAEPRPTMF
jgi:ABC-type phosphate transport system substrate-binding protein